MMKNNSDSNVNIYIKIVQIKKTMNEKPLTKAVLENQI